jgi:hypothetical protein
VARQYHFQREVRLKDIPDREDFYWALFEVDASGTQVGPDQFPWHWTLWFHATEVVLSDVLESEVVLPELQGQRAIREDWAAGSRTIRACLRSASSPTYNPAGPHTTYRMFGADREITDLRLEVLPILSPGDKPECRVSGSPRYTSNTWFGSETIEDAIVFAVSVPPEMFERYAKRVAEDSVNEIVLGVADVGGFYSASSSSTSTSEIKVLTNVEDTR